MEARLIIFVYSNFILGGAETLILRMSEWLIKRGDKVVLVCHSMDETIKKDKRIGRIECILTKKKDKKRKILKILQKNNNIKDKMIINFFVKDYLLIERLNKKNDFQNIFYVVHPNNTLSYCKKGLLLSKIKKYIYKNQIKKMYDKNCIYFMDEDCIKIAEKYYKMSLSKSYSNIIRIPIQVDKFDNKTRKKSFNILTIARFDFPFKGYLLGLIDDFIYLKEIYPQATLTIIGDGKDRDKIEKKLERLNKKITKDIMIIGAVPYLSLNSYFKKASIYVGMGTTVLDAVNRGVPAITVYSYSYEAKTLGFFYEHPNVLAGFTEGGSYPKIAVVELLERVFDLNIEDYDRLVEKNYQALKNTYDIEIVLPKFFN